MHYDDMDRDACKRIAEDLKKTTALGQRYEEHKAVEREICRIYGKVLEEK